ncbi:hypothetical protein RC1_3447 [Rhodospirillum centenum SW]|uniref:Uncharacterized protein n=1 Tax=Rhodospirillum centenum (strain ATCC 51521 / SW) TaxID=414684 RepID=B6IWY1_RHOCS|nr:hypothetical protein RC1_3447 [Rhodospirillum centenum SW]
MWTDFGRDRACHGVSSSLHVSLFRPRLLGAPERRQPDLREFQGCSSKGWRAPASRSLCPECRAPAPPDRVPERP